MKASSPSAGRWPTPQPRSRAREVIAADRSLMAEAPDALGGGLMLDGATVSVLAVYTGPAEPSTSCRCAP